MAVSSGWSRVAWLVLYKQMFSLTDVLFWLAGSNVGKSHGGVTVGGFRDDRDGFLSFGGSLFVWSLVLFWVLCSSLMGVVRVFHQVVCITMREGDDNLCSWA